MNPPCLHQHVDSLGLASGSRDASAANATAESTWARFRSSSGSSKSFKPSLLIALLRSIGLARPTVHPLEQPLQISQPPWPKQPLQAGETLGRFEPQAGLPLLAERVLLQHTLRKPGPQVTGMRHHQMAPELKPIPFIRPSQRPGISSPKQRLPFVAKALHRQRPLDARLRHWTTQVPVTHRRLPLGLFLTQIVHLRSLHKQAPQTLVVG